MEQLKQLLRAARQVAGPGRRRLGAGPAGVTSAIVGASKPEQLDESLAAAGLTLEAEERRRAIWRGSVCRGQRSQCADLAVVHISVGACHPITLLALVTIEYDRLSRSVMHAKGSPSWSHGHGKLARRRAVGAPGSQHEVVQRYTQRLLGLARRQLPQRLRQRVDPEDVVQSVYRSFFRRLNEGCFHPRRLPLFRLLAAMTFHKRKTPSSFTSAAAATSAAKTPREPQTLRPSPPRNRVTRMPLSCSIVSMLAGRAAG